MQKGGETCYLHGDHLGSTVGTTKSSGTEIFTYRAFGDSRSGTNPSTERQYTGQIQDDNQLMYYNTRYYDKYLGIFISADTLIPDPTDIASYHRYMYANGNPKRYTDPSGYCGATAVMGPAGIPIDIACWVSVGATVGTGVIAVGGAVVLVGAMIYTFPEDTPLNYPPPSTSEVPATIQESFPLPDSTTLESDISGFYLEEELAPGIHGI